MSLKSMTWMMLPRWPTSDDFDEDDVAALDGVAVTAAAEEAIALIDMKTSPEGTCGHRIDCAPRSPLQRGECAKQAQHA